MRTSRFMPLAALALLLPALAATPVFDGVPNAENQLAAGNGRWFVSGDGAVYEGRYDGRAYRKRALVARLRDGSPHACTFLGLAERRGRLFAVCSDSTLDPFAAKRLFSLDLADPAAELREIARPAGIALPNDLAVDPDGHLLLADSGAPLLPGRLWRLTLDAAGVVTGQAELHAFPLCKPNGLRVDGDRLYVSLNPLSYVGVSQLKRYRLTAGGLADGSTLYSSWGFIDDFALTTDGAVVAEFLAGRVSHVSEGGQVLRQAAFAQPTSVRVSAGGDFPAGAITVTERGNGRLLLDAGFGAWPR